MRRLKGEILMYSEKVMDHFSNPRNVGEIAEADGVGEVGNAKCGDIMKIYLQIENNIIKDVKFKTFGCGAAIATSSIATEMIKGKTVEEALELTNKAVIEALDGLPPAKIHCSVLAEEAVKAAIEDYMKKQGKGTESTGFVGEAPDEECCCSSCNRNCK
jgi:nitrogen fixation NifU-like protein